MQSKVPTEKRDLCRIMSWKPDTVMLSGFYNTNTALFKSIKFKKLAAFKAGVAVWGPSDNYYFSIVS